MLFEYITRLLMDNCFIEFFIEGTRSRNFKMLCKYFITLLYKKKY